MSLRFLLFLFMTCAIISSACKVKSFYGNNASIDHAEWTVLLSQYVNDDGWVDYKGLQSDTDRLEVYLNKLKSNHPNPNTWSREERMAYWINAYNAFTVKLIIDNYPIESIKDIKKGIAFINSVWDIEFIQIEGQNYTLNNIEHGILRPKFEEPRVHFAINCASFSCPVLSKEAYTAENLEAQLTQAAKQFLSDTRRNQVTAKSLKLSKIFSWFKGDFTTDQSLIDFLNQYADIKIDSKAEVEFLEYDWRINDIQ